MADGIDLMYVSCNRLEMTKASFAALIANTNWDLVRRLFLFDDKSRDQTFAYLLAAAGSVPVEVVSRHQKFGGPVAAMKLYLGRDDKAELLAKVDNDFVMCPGWLEALVAVLDANPELDIVGTEPGILLDVPAQGFDALTPMTRDGYVRAYRYRPCEHIGGKGLMRVSAFDGRPMRPHGKNGYFGFTEWQVKHPEVREGWIDPDLHCFGLDQLPLEPWMSLTNQYVSQGWQRPWPKYSPAAHEYWDWWLA